MILVPVHTFASFDQNLKYGSSGTVVKELQDFLFEEGCLTVTPTGRYLTKTYFAVKCFQTKYGIPSTGYFGPLTRMKVTTMKSQIVNVSTSTPVLTPTPSPTDTSPTQGAKPTQGDVVSGVKPVVQPVTPPAQIEMGNGCLNKVKGDACSYGAAPNGICDNALNGHLLFCIPKRTQ